VVAVTVDPLDRYVYGAVAGVLPGYAIAPITGGLTQLTNSPYVASMNPFSVAVDPSGAFAYPAN
jgi:DNA-binding beta-propeller fold protein YncE